MTLEARIRTIVTNKLDKYGFSVSVYLSPSYTYDDEGDGTITKGTATSGKMFFFSPRGEMITPEIEGVDLQQPFTCYLKHNVGTIEENNIIGIDRTAQSGTTTEEYFKITKIDRWAVGSAEVTFYELEIERIQPQNTVS